MLGGVTRRRDPCTGRPAMGKEPWPSLHTPQPTEAAARGTAAKSMNITVTADAHLP